MCAQPKITSSFLFIVVICALIAFYSTGCNKGDKNATSGGSGTGVFASGSSEKPNIIVILSDDIGYEVPTYSGGQSYSTPNLDFIASAGTQFTQCHAAPLCSPSRFMLMTGKYNFRNYTHWGILGSDQQTLANLAKTAGYTTCISGKWQFDGGDQAIHNFGFEDYAVNEAFNSATGEETANDFYKDPTVYTNGQYLPDSYTKDKYGPDIYRDFVFNFIDSNKNKPFFIYWAMNLCHKPFSPTPDDPDYASWISGQRPNDEDVKYFPSMVKYMDKQIGQLIAKLQQMQLDKNTLIIFSGDNGTPHDVYSQWNGQTIQGGKSQIKERGYHVPLLAYLPGSVPSGRKDVSMIDYTDFMSTFADMFKTSVPASYGTVDGVSFYPQLEGLMNNKGRSWIFCQYAPHPEDPLDSSSKGPRRWIQNSTYKEYDTIQNFIKSKRFYNIQADPEEEQPLYHSDRSLEMNFLYDDFKTSMESLH